MGDRGVSRLVSVLLSSASLSLSLPLSLTKQICRFIPLCSLQVERQRTLVSNMDWSSVQPWVWQQRRQRAVQTHCGSMTWFIQSSKYRQAVLITSIDLIRPNYNLRACDRLIIGFWRVEIIEEEILQINACINGNIKLCFLHLSPLWKRSSRLVVRF